MLTEHYEEGRVARFDSKSRMDNPHLRSGDRAKRIEWDQGWKDADAELMIVNCRRDGVTVPSNEPCGSIGLSQHRGSDGCRRLGRVRHPSIPRARRFVERRRRRARRQPRHDGTRSAVDLAGFRSASDDPANRTTKSRPPGSCRHRIALGIKPAVHAGHPEHRRAAPTCRKSQCD